MKIVWLTNIILPVIAGSINAPTANSGGWMVAFANSLQANKNLSLTVCFPTNGKGTLEGTINQLSYHGFVRKFSDPTKYDATLESEFQSVINRYQPDIIHIWGTEHPHTLAMVRTAHRIGMENKIVISIQGLCSKIATHYLSGIPMNFQNKKTLRDLIKNESLLRQRDKFLLRGQYEVEALQSVKHIIGRTTWDKACTKQINPQAKYHFCNETLRDSFYDKQWSIENCKKYSIFMSQGSYPIKGLHFMLEAMPLILDKFPDATLEIAGLDITKDTKFVEKIRISAYGKFIISLIKRHKLSKHITFIGEQNEKQIVEKFLESHVFVSPSTIENSSNSVGEAMLLGVPVVSSNVGGINEMLVHNSEGFLYQSDAPYMLAHYVCQLFGDDDLAAEFSKKAKIHAMQTHNKEVNESSLLDIYKDISNC